MSHQFMCSWPDPRLNPNNRSHWSKKADARSLQRTEAKMLTRASVPIAAQLKFYAAQRLRLRLQFIQPDRKARDMDNLIASCKGLIDGVADAVGVDDRHFKLEFDMDAEPQKYGGVRVTVEELQ